MPGFSFVMYHSSGASEFSVLFMSWEAKPELEPNFKKLSHVMNRFLGTSDLFLRLTLSFPTHGPPDCQSALLLFNKSVNIVPNCDL